LRPTRQTTKASKQFTGKIKNKRKKKKGAENFFDFQKYFQPRRENLESKRKKKKGK
jgi:hypothetical protein